MVEMNRRPEVYPHTPDEVLQNFVSNNENAAREAYNQIIRQFHGLVFRAALIVIHNPELSKDIVQQTFLKAWNNRRNFNTQQPLGPWLYAIAQRTALDSLRNPIQRQSVSLDQLKADKNFELSDDDVAATSSWHRSEATVDQLAKINTTIDLLARTESPENILILRLHYNRGYELKTIRQHLLEKNPPLSLSVDAINSRLHRLLEKLRKLVHNLPDEIILDQPPIQVEKSTAETTPTPATEPTDPRAKLIAAIAQIPDDSMADILYRSLVKGEKDEVLAARFGITKNAMSQRISHGRKRLTTLLTEPIPELHSTSPRLDELRRVAMNSDTARSQLAKLVAESGRKSTVRLLTLHFLDGLTAQQIVEREGLIENTVRQAIFRATQKFEEILAEQSTVN